MQLLRRFLADLDAQWTPLSPEPQVLPIIGAGALMLRTRYERGTKDGDILQTRALDDRVKAQLLDLAGPRSKLFIRHRIYVDVIHEALPLLPRKPLWHPLEPSPGLVHFEVQVLDVVDVVVSKLKRLHADDLADITAMIDLGFVTHVSLLERFREAVEAYQYGAGADALPHCVRNLHRIERDLLMVPESEIELPAWVE